MNSLPRQKLCELVARHGVGLCDDAPRCVSLLLEACPGEDRAIHVLTSALKERVAIDLRDAPASAPIKLTLSKLMKRLEVDQHLSSEVARWVVESWALALGKISDADLAWLHATSSPQGSAPASKPGVPQPPRPARPQPPRPAGPQSARPQPPPAARPHGAQPARPQPPPPARPHGALPVQSQPPPPTRPQVVPLPVQRLPEPPVPAPSQPAPKPSRPEPEPEPVIPLPPPLAPPAQKQSPEPSPAQPVDVLSSPEAEVLLSAAEPDDVPPVVEVLETLPLAKPAGNLQWVKTDGKLQIAKPDTKIPAAKLADAPSPVKASETPPASPATKAAAGPDSTDLLPLAKSAEPESTPVVHPLATILAPTKHAPRRGATALLVLAIVGVLLGVVAWWTFFRDWRGEAEHRQEEARERQKKMEESSDPQKVPRWMRRSWKTLPN